jgi:hypothetical protein
MKDHRPPSCEEHEGREDPTPPATRPTTETTTIGDAVKEPPPFRKNGEKEPPTSAAEEHHTGAEVEEPKEPHSNVTDPGDTPSSSHLPRAPQ